MSKWNSIPNEVLRLIILQLESSNKLHQCLNVNKQWFTICQPILYKNVSINKFQEDDNLVNTLLHSSYQSGQFVQSIEFKEELLSPAENLKNIELSRDLLHLLMIKCPHVKEVNFLCGFYEEKNYGHFLIALKNTNSWKLQTIPDMKIFDDDINQYNRLADIMKDSLTHIVVAKWENDHSYYGYLKEYPNLLSIDIVFSGYANIADCVEMMRNAPLLESVCVEFDDYAGNPDAGLNNDILNLVPFSNIKKLHFINFNPSCEMELLFIENKFTNVTDLCITMNQRNWTEKRFSSSAIINFLNYVKNIPMTSMNIDHITEFEIFKYYYHVSSGNTLKLGFAHQNSVSTCTTELSFSNNEMTLTVKYPRLEDPMIRFETAKKCLIIVEGYTRSFSFRFDTKSEELNKYINFVLAYYRHLYRLEFYKGSLKSVPLTMANRSNSLSQLIMRNVKIAGNSLYHLTRCLTNLEQLKLEGCQFLGYSQNSSKGSHYYDIMMNNTKIRSFEIVEWYQLGLSRKQPSIFVQITLLNDGTQEECYIANGDGTNVLKVKKGEFIAAKQNIVDQKSVVMIYLMVLSIESFTYTAPDGVKFKLEFS